MTPMVFHQTYAVWTEESVEHGEAEESGFDWEDMPHSFKDLVHLLKRNYCGAEACKNPRWITAHGDPDLFDGSRRDISLHPANDRAKRWWMKALKAAGIVD